jgi:rod shape-determining protein MreB
MAIIELAIDMGTSNTYIYQRGVGLVLKEPSVVAVGTHSNNKVVKAAGLEAKKLIGKTPGDTTVVFPMFEGVVVSVNMATVMLKYFLNKVVPRGILRPRVSALFTLPCGATDAERRLVEQIAKACGINEIRFIESVLAAGLGVSMPISNARAGLVLDIGGGTSEIGVISLSGIISGYSLCLAGYNADVAIIDFFADNFGIKIGLASAERVKCGVGSLLDGDNMSTLVSGLDITKNKPASIEVVSGDIKALLAKTYDKIADVTEHILHDLHGETSGDILENGLYICGGGSSLAGLLEMLERRLNLSVKTIEDPSTAAILGAGKLLDKDLYNNFFLSKEEMY